MSLRLRLTIIYSALTGSILLIFGILLYSLVNILLVSQVDTTLNQTANDLLVGWRVGPGGDFLQDPNTLRFLRSGEHFYTGSFETSGSPESARTMIENLHARVEQILARHQPIVPVSRVEDLRRYVEANR